MSETIRLVLIEDHEMVRAGFQMLLGAQPDMEIVGEAESGAEGLAIVAEMRPDVVLLDVSMPGMGGAEPRLGPPASVGRGGTVRVVPRLRKQEIYSKMWYQLRC